MEHCPADFEGSTEANSMHTRTESSSGDEEAPRPQHQQKYHWWKLRSLHREPAQSMKHHQRQPHTQQPPHRHAFARAASQMLHRHREAKAAKAAELEEASVPPPLRSVQWMGVPGEKGPPDMVTDGAAEALPNGRLLSKSSREHSRSWAERGGPIQPTRSSFRHTESGAERGGEGRSVQFAMPPPRPGGGSAADSVYVHPGEGQSEQEQTLEGHKVADGTDRNQRSLAASSAKGAPLTQGSVAAAAAGAWRFAAAQGRESGQAMQQQQSGRFLPAGLQLPVSPFLEQHLQASVVMLSSKVTFPPHKCWRTAPAGIQCWGLAVRILWL